MSAEPFDGTADLKRVATAVMTMKGHHVVLTYQQVRC